MDDLPISDLELLQRFSKKGDERAFEALVVRYANLVFGVALRRGVGQQGAEDVTQKVFAVLARKAKKLKRKASLAGWLSRTASLEAAYLRRSESNRQRKMDNYQQSGAAADVDEGKGDDLALWRAALPHLDDVLSDLPPGDQEVVLQRFYNGQSFAAIASLANKSEAAVQKQSRRALDKMSKLLKRRGVAVPTVALAGLLGTELAKATPATAFNALSQGAISTAPEIAGSAILTNTLETMAYAKTKVALVVAAVAAIPTGMQWSKINELEAQIAAAKPMPASDGRYPLAALEVEVADLKGRLAEATASAKPRAVTAMGKSGAKDAGAAGEAGALAGLADMFEDPGMHELMKSQMKGQISSMYGELIESLDLADGKKAQLEELLVDRQMDMARLGIRAMNGGLSEEEKDEARDAMTLAREESDEKLGEFLGDEGFEQFQRYEDSTTERTELTAFKQGLARAGAEGISLEQEEKLMGMMYEERKAYQFTSNFDPSASAVPEWDPTPETIEAIAADHRGLRQQIAARAGEVLDEKQVGLFLENQESFQKMMEAGLEMSLKMLGGTAGRAEE